MGLRGSTTDGDIGGLGFTDPPEHTRLRKLLTPEFTMRRLERLRPRIADIVEKQLDEIERQAAENDGVVDLVPTFAFPIPFLVICELLGLPDEDRETFRQLGSARFDVSYGGQGVFGAVSDSRKFLMEATRKQRDNPGDGLIGQIIREHGDEINDFDLAGLADGVFTGGLETSASMLALGTAVLMDHPDDFRRVGTDPTVVDRTVEELLRYLTVVQVAFPRFPKTEVEVGGHRISPGDVVICQLAGANRDPRLGRPDGRVRPDPAGDHAPRLRARLPPLRGRRARPDGAADGVPGARPALPGPVAGDRPRGLPRRCPSSTAWTRCRSGCSRNPRCAEPRVPGMRAPVRLALLAVLLAALGACTNTGPSAPRPTLTLPTPTLQRAPGADETLVDELGIAVRPARTSLRDPRGDVRLVTTDPPATTVVRDASIDVTGLRVVHGRDAVRVTLRFADLRPVGRPTVDLGLTTPRGRWFLDLTTDGARVPRRPSRFVGPDGAGRGCPGFSRSVDLARDVVDLTVPRGCLADPAWVTVRVLVSRPTPAGTLFENPHNTRPFSEFGTARLYPDAPAGRG